MNDAAERAEEPLAQLTLAWTGHDELQPVLANQMLIRVDATNEGIPDTVTIVFGLAEPPLALDAEQLAALRELKVVESRAVAKVALGTGRLREFANVLTRVADQVDDALGREKK